MQAGNRTPGHLNCLKNFQIKKKFSGYWLPARKFQTKERSRQGGKFFQGGCCWNIPSGHSVSPSLAVISSSEAGIPRH